MKKPKSTSLGFACVGALGLFASASALAPAIQAQALSAPCPPGGFDICFPDLESGAPNAACAVASSSAADGADAASASDADLAADAAAVAAADAQTSSACLSQVCWSEESEPLPGFFEYCCARGGSERYDDYCVLVVQNECSAVAQLCAERCAPFALLLAGVTLAPPTVACLDSYPAFVAGVCAADPFCRETSWDSICAREAVAASLFP